MKRSSTITGIRNRTRFSKRILRKFVNSQLATKAWKEKADRKGLRFSANYEIISFSSTVLPVSGTLDILFDAKHPESISRISIPVQSNFLVTCTQEGMDDYKVAWSSSLS